MRLERVTIIVFLLGNLAMPFLAAAAEDLPVRNLQKNPALKELPYYGIKNLLSIDQLYSCIKDGDKNGLSLDMSGITRLLDGTEIDPQHIYGALRVGPNPFEGEEVDYTYKKFRLRKNIVKGHSNIPVSAFLGQNLNSEDWLDQGQVVVRLELYLRVVDREDDDPDAPQKHDRFLGVFDTFTGFKRVGDEFMVRPALLEGPMVSLIRSDRFDEVIIAFKTTMKVKSQVVLDGIKIFPSGEPGFRHEIKISGLSPGKEYSYVVEYGSNKTKSYRFHTAPKPGKDEAVFAYAGDSREGVAGGSANFMGVNYLVMERIANLAYRLGADFFLFGGDLVSGYTSGIADFKTQLSAWKQSMAGFWRQRAVYTCIGNHEALLRVFIDGDNLRSSYDRWPYDTESVEAIFASEMVNPLNGPATSDPRRPAYRENVYSFAYGPVKIIAFNNNYWVGYQDMSDTGPKDIGGSPEGYIMRDQMDWIQKELDEGEIDSKIKYIVLFAQEPVFPNGGHVKDCMWYHGNNHVTAYTFDAAAGVVKPEPEGIITVRNRLVTMVSQNSKVAAVLGSDEHSYHKTLITRYVPVGDPTVDDPDGKGYVCREGFGCSPLPSIHFPTWYITCGGAGAPYYNKESTPWNYYWEQNPAKCPGNTSMRGCFYYSSQENFLLFRATKKKISVVVYNPYGDIIDSIDDLLAVKGRK